MKYVYMNRKQAEWAGMAPSVAGGWVRADMMVDSRGTLHSESRYSPDAFAALVPDSWDSSDYLREATQAEVEHAISERQKAEAICIARVNAEKEEARQIAREIAAE